MATTKHPVKIEDGIYVLQQIIKVLKKSREIEDLNFSFTVETRDIPFECFSAKVPSGWVDANINLRFLNLTKKKALVK